MSDEGTALLRELGRRGHEPLWAKVSGRVRLELVDGSHIDRWLVEIDKGDVVVSHKGGAADCTIRADRTLFDRISRGETNATAAVLRGAMVCTGDVDLLFAMQRVFPGPDAAARSREDSE